MQGQEGGDRVTTPCSDSVDHKPQWERPGMPATSVTSTYNDWPVRSLAMAPHDMRCPCTCRGQVHVEQETQGDPPASCRGRIYAEQGTQAVSPPRQSRCHSPLELRVPSSYVFMSTKSTKSLGEMSFMAAEGLVVLLTHNVCQSTEGRAYGHRPPCPAPHPASGKRGVWGVRPSEQEPPSVLCLGSLLVPPGRPWREPPLIHTPISEYATRPPSRFEVKVAPNPTRLYPTLPFSSRAAALSGAQGIRAGQLQDGTDLSGAARRQEGAAFKGLGLKTEARSVLAETPVP